MSFSGVRSFGDENPFARKNGKYTKQMTGDQIAEDKEKMMASSQVEKSVEQELQLETKKSNEDNSEILKEINNYHKLKSLLSKKLNRVI